MTLARTAYFMSLVGGIAGLLAWAVITLLSFLLVQDQTWTDLISKMLLGALLGGMALGFQDRWSGNPVMARYVLLGVGLGMLAGVIAGVIQIPIGRSLGPSLPLASRLIAWVLAGSFIGVALGFRWISENPGRVMLSFAGGLAGGAVGGLLFSVVGGGAADVAAAFSYVIVGVGIAAGCTLAATLLRTGVLEFVSSADAHTQSKLRRGVGFWELRDGDSCVIGHRSPSLRETQFRIESAIYLPDPAVADRHAKVFAKQGRFYVTRDPAISHQAAKYILKVRGKTVVGGQELANSDDIVVGVTTFRFLSGRRRARPQ